MTNTRTIIFKTIYAKRKGLTKEQMGEIFRVEAMEHIRANPDLFFLKIGTPVENKDMSKTFPIYFGVRPTQPAQ